MDSIIIKRSYSINQNSEEAINEICSQLSSSDPDLIILFCSSNFNLGIISQKIKESFSCPVFACTTSGEINQYGYANNSISAASIKSDKMRFHLRFINDVKNFNVHKAVSITDSIHKDLEFSTDFMSNDMFALLLIDGMSLSEDRTIALLSKALNQIGIAGGSSGDDLNFKKTFVYYDGKFVDNSAVILIVECKLPFIVFRTQHFEPSTEKLVITEADSNKRIVYEINGAPAAEEYARLIGIKMDHLNSQIFAKHPVMLNIGGKWYVRSIAKMNEDGSLYFYCAIDEGIVLTLANGNNIISNLAEQFDNLKNDLPDIKLIIGFDCILRRIEVEENNLTKEMNTLLSKEIIVGFNTYGEQCTSVHVNQTITGVAIGA